jgi:hypothetical protein
MAMFSAKVKHKYGSGKAVDTKWRTKNPDGPVSPVIVN